MSGALAVLTISESDPFSFGTVVVGGNSTQIFTINNTGTGTATSMAEVGLAAPFGFSGGAFPGTSGTCGATLAPAATCTIEVEFAPTSAGIANDTISISYNDGAGIQNVNRDVTGTGVVPALLTISDSPGFHFGNVQIGFTSNHIFTVTNSGGFTATGLFGIGLSSPYSFTGGGYPGVGGTCTSTLPPGSNCSLDVTYAPTSTGFSLDAIKLIYNDGVVSQQANRDVSGNGTP